MLIIFVQFQDSHKCLLRDIYRTDGFHPFFTFGLLFEEFLFPRNITTITFSEDIFAEGGDVFTGDDFVADRQPNKIAILLGLTEKYWERSNFTNMPDSLDLL